MNEPNNTAKTRRLFSCQHSYLITSLVETSAVEFHLCLTNSFARLIDLTPAFVPHVQPPLGVLFSDMAGHPASSSYQDRIKNKYISAVGADPIGSLGGGGGAFEIELTCLLAVYQNLFF